MLLMGHFYKTVMNMGYYYHQMSTNRHMGQELWELKTIKCHMTSSKQIFAIHRRLNWKLSILKHLDTF